MAKLCALSFPMSLLACKAQAGGCGLNISMCGEPDKKTNQPGNS